MVEKALRVPWEDVVQAGAAQVQKEGAAELRLENVAARLGVAPEAVRYWFSSEAELLISVMQIRQRWFIDQAETRLARVATSAEKLRELIELCSADHDVTYWIELWKLALRDERARAQRQELTGRYRELFARVIRGGQRRGEFAAVSPEQVALVLVALVVGLSVEVTTNGDADPERMRAILTAVCERLLELELTQPA